MKSENKKIILYSLILVLVLLGCLGATLFIIPEFFEDSARIAILILWIGLAIIAAPIENDHTRFKGKTEKIKTTLIIVIIYNILYFLLGLIFGYQRNPLSIKFFSIIKNLVFIVGVIALQDFVRSKVINNQRKKINYVVFTIVFIILRLDYSQGYAVLSSGEKIFEYLCSTVFTEIARGCVCTYLAYTGGTLLVYSYTLPMALRNVLLPIFPNLDWFLTSVLEVLVSVIIFVYNNYVHTIRTNRITRKERKNISPVKQIPVLIILLISVTFITGFLPAKPIAIMSYSMVPTFSRGAVVISVKLDEKGINNLKVGDIIQYQTDSGDVIHRIIEIKKDEKGNLLFQTKGDNNSAPDSNLVQPEQILGCIKLNIPYIGYPSVWFGEKILGKKSFITI